MNTLAVLSFIAETIIREGNHSGSGMPKIVFWLLLILWAIGAFGFRDNPRVVLGTNFVLIVLFCILGWYTFGF